MLAVTGLVVTVKVMLLLPGGMALALFRVALGRGLLSEPEPLWESSKAFAPTTSLIPTYLRVR